MKYLLFILLLTGCSVQKSITERPYICYEVFETSNKEVVHRFANLSLTKGRDEYLDSILCHPFDTVVIKDYERGLFRKRKTVFVINK
jgi:predicted oxidoreductase